jgi:hypothetical protein
MAQSSDFTLRPSRGLSFRTNEPNSEGAAGAGGPAVQNKANLPGASGKGHAAARRRLYKQSQLAPRTGPSLASIVRNEPNFSIADCGLGTDLRRDASAAAYRLQPAERKMYETNPIWREQRGLGGLPCKTKPIRRGRPAMGAGRQVGPAGATKPNVRNEAN